MAKQLPLTCPGHTRPVVHLGFSNITANGGYFLITACKGEVLVVSHCALNPYTDSMTQYDTKSLPCCTPGY